MNRVHDQCLVLQIIDETVGGLDIDRNIGVSFENAFDVRMELIQLATFDRLFASFSEDNRFR